MAIYRKPFTLVGEAVIKADSEEEAERAFLYFTQAELGAIAVLETEDVYRDFEAEMKERLKREELFKEASLG